MMELTERIFTIVNMDKVTIPVESELLDAMFSWCKKNDTDIVKETVRMYRTCTSNS